MRVAAAPVDTSLGFILENDDEEANPVIDTKADWDKDANWYIKYIVNIIIKISLINIQVKRNHFIY